MQKFAVKLPCYIRNYYVSMKSKESVNFLLEKNWLILKKVTR